jgi:large subunit ribosomal protein L4
MMPKIDVYNTQNTKVSEIELDQGIFDDKVKEHLIYDMIRMQLANRRRGTASTKGRSEIRGGGRKPWRQKGTGRARAGTIRSPLWKGGGVVFGPKPRDFSIKLNKKMKKAAFRSVLTQKLREGDLIVLDELRLNETKTKAFLEVMATLGIDNALIVARDHDEKLFNSARNVPRVKVLPVEGLNVFDILKYKKLILLEPSLEKIEKAISA